MKHLLFVLQYYALKENGNVNTNYGPIQHSNYYKLIKKWLKIFPRNQFHFVNGDTLIKDPVTPLKKVEKYLGIKPYISQENFSFNETKGFYCWEQWNGEEYCLPPKKGRTHPEIDQDVRSKLTDYFRPYNKRFFKLIGEDFGWPT